MAAGLCYGSTFALVLALAADLFGSEHVATNYGLLDLGEPAGRFAPAKGFGELVCRFFSCVYLVAVQCGVLHFFLVLHNSRQALTTINTGVGRLSPVPRLCVS